MKLLRKRSLTTYALALGACLMVQKLAHAQTPTLDPELNKKLLNAPQGSIVELPGILTEKLPQNAYQKICDARSAIPHLRRS